MFCFFAAGTCPRFCSSCPISDHIQVTVNIMYQFARDKLELLDIVLGIPQVTYYQINYFIETNSHISCKKQHYDLLFDPGVIELTRLLIDRVFRFLLSIVAAIETCQSRDTMTGVVLDYQTFPSSRDVLEKLVMNLLRTWSPLLYCLYNNQCQGRC